MIFTKKEKPNWQEYTSISLFKKLLPVFSEVLEDSVLTVHWYLTHLETVALFSTELSH